MYLSQFITNTFLIGLKQMTLVSYFVKLIYTEVSQNLCAPVPKRNEWFPFFYMQGMLGGG